MRDETVFIKIKNSVKKLNIMVLILTGLFLSSSTFAVNIAKTPLFLNQSAPPNIMFILDDSGSMDWDILVPPHWEATNYDRDYVRSWARGGILNDSDSNLGRRSVGDWVSYPGTCKDRNVDGICFNNLDLNSDGDVDDKEKASTGAGQLQTYLWKLRLYHRYRWNFPSGYCKPPAAGGTDAGDFLPRFDNVLAFLSGSKKAVAHTYTGTNWPSVNPFAGMTDPAYSLEQWQEIPSSRTYILSPSEAAEKALCDAKTDGSVWKSNGVGQTLIHTGSTPWVSAGTIANPTLAAPGYTPGVVGNYHAEATYDIGDPFIAATPNFDINGDGTVNTNYREQDSASTRRIGYEYFSYNSDNVYYSGSAGNTCNGGGSTSGSPEGCKHLQYTDYPNNYAYDANAPATATSYSLPGNENILTLPSSVNAMRHVPPAIVIGKNFDAITWAAWSDPTRGIINRTTPVGTRHALNKWDPWPLVSDWRLRSAGLNVLYYNHDIEYSAWPGLTDADFNAVHSNPQPGSAGFVLPTKDLVRPQAGVAETNAALMGSAGNIEEGGFVYEVWHDDAGYWSNSPHWYTNDKCNTPFGGATPGVNAGSYTHGAPFGWRAGYWDGRYGATVRSHVVGVVDPATGQVVGPNDYLCSTYNDLPNGEVDLWDTRDRVTVYNDGILVQTVRRTPHIFGEPKDSNNTQNYPMSDTRISNTVTYLAGTTYPKDGFCETVLGIDPTNTANCKTVAQVQQNAANWYEFSRRRSFVAKGAIASLMVKIDDVNYGLMATSRNDTVSNNKTNATDLSIDISDLFRDVYDGNGSGNGDAVRSVHNATLQTELYNHVFRKSGTPLRQALQRAGEYFAGRGPDLSGGGLNTDPDNHSTSPITESCQKNFALMLTDGYRSGLAPADVAGTDRFSNAISLDNADGDVYTKTLADVAKYYYDEDLSAEDNKVPTDTFNTNDAQHLTTIGVGFGVTGSLVDGNNNGWPGSVAGGSALTESSNWGNPNNNPRKIDDLWHAAYNSRGLYLSASNPKELLDSLEAAIFFALKETGSASSLTLNDDLTTTTGTRLYQTVFRSGEWTGDVLSLKRDASGAFASVDWSAQSRLGSVAYGSRKIFTLDASGASAVPFRFTSLSVPQQNAMKVRQITGASDLDGDKHVNYIRGDSTNEGTLFRNRLGKKLGDIVHSAVLRVDVPKAAYPDNWGAGQPENGAAYSSFKALHNPTLGAPRPTMLFAGANDGMLHAFDAATGDEKYAYIPKALIPKLNYLSHLPSATNPFKHQFYVDDTPVSRDAFFGGAWHTALVGGLRGGGKAIYALDITTVPGGAATEASIGSAKHLWEFTNANDADLGFTFSRPQIARLANGKWVAIFGNGYQDDATGKAVLYVVDLANGSLIKKIVADGADVDNGLSSPTIVDVNDDYITDFVYAGDLKGNLWRFDLTDPLPANWHVSFAGSPLFVAHETGLPLSKQPITVAPTVETHPRGLLAGYLVSFGTGKYMEPTDNNVAGEKTQTLYTIWDYGSGNVNRADLLIQNVLFQASPPYGHRATSANGVSWMDTGHNIGDPSWEANIDDTGWYIDLTFAGSNEGERQVNKALLFGKYLTFDSLIPSTDACSAGGGSRRYILDRESGANFLGAPVDLNGDGIIDAAEAAAFMNAFYTEGYSYDDGNAQIPNVDGTFTTYIDKSSAQPIQGALPIVSVGERRSWIQLD